MNIINLLIFFVMTYWLDILVVAAMLVFMAYLLKQGKKDLVKKIIYDLVVKAEIALGGGTGDLKYNMVITNYYNKLPFIVRLVFSRAEINKLILDGVESLKTYLGQGKNLLNYSQEVKVKALPVDIILSNAEINNVP
jgi:hypothetical protein